MPGGTVLSYCYISRGETRRASGSLRVHGAAGAGAESSARIRISATVEAGADVTAGKPIQVQVFGTRKSADTRKALRFFSERRVTTHFVDVLERPPSPGELRRFVERFGVATLVDRQSRRFAELGLAQAVRSDDWWIQRLSEEPLLLRFPLVRCGQQVTVGHEEGVWRSWVDRS